MTKVIEKIEEVSAEVSNEVEKFDFETFAEELEDMDYLELQATTKKEKSAKAWNDLSDAEKLKGYKFHLQNTSILKKLNGGIIPFAKFKILTPETCKTENGIWGDKVFRIGGTLEFLKDHTVRRDTLQVIQPKPANKTTKVTFTDIEGIFGEKGAKISYSRAGQSAACTETNSISLDAVKVID